VRARGRDVLVAELQTHLAAARARLIEQDRELARARRTSMATESVSRQARTAAEQAEAAARRGVATAEEAADLEAARLRLDLAASEAQRRVLEECLDAARAELEAKRPLAGEWDGVCVCVCARARVCVCVRHHCS
jgi:RecG-like helicase